MGAGLDPPRRGTVPKPDGRPMLYVVYVSVTRSVADEWLRWMVDEHVPDVLATGCFVRATVCRDSAGDDDDTIAYRVQYQTETEAALERYIADFSPALKKDHADRFASKVTARRDILSVVAEFIPDGDE